ncbi:transient receptor potential cation channel subfamily M member 2-like [Brachionus plicatilis]|uniref:Transient receptor potential cation channel subfamily M member 2-like n=1 Tax=Brachionus plicatilis TaxID=10195 RepID=A0A3M7QL35_BRAPC|nr:transient receptor potential cation channel subfamily M member 2-like [Brachionus plicatilis]
MRNYCNYNFFDNVLETQIHGFVNHKKTSSLCYSLKQLDSPEKTNSYDDLKKDISRILEKNNRESVSILEFDPRAVQQKSRNFKILSIFLKANPKHKVAELCLSWNRCDIARLALFNDEIPDNMDMYQDLMLNALLNNQVEFVNLLLENGFSLKNFLTYDRFIKLYARKLSQDSLITKLFRKLLNKDTNIHFDSIDFKSIGQCIQKLVDNLFKHEFTSDDFEKFLSQLSGEDLTIEKLNNPEYHLFIFNILLGRQRLSEIFWIQGEA